MGDPGEPASDGELLTDGTYVRRQRTALRDLLELSAQCARRDGEIEQRFRTRRDGVSARHDRLEAYLQERSVRLRSEMEAAHRAELERLNARIERQRRERAAEHERRVRRIQDEANAELDRLSQELNQAMWLADSVFEGAEARLRQEQTGLREGLTRQRRTLESLEYEGNRQLQRYRQSYALADLPASTGEPEAPDGPAATPNDFAQAYARRLEEVRRRLADLQRLSAPKWLSAWGVSVGIGVPMVAALAGGYAVASATGATGLAMAAVYGVALAAAWAVVIAAGAAVWWRAKKQVRQAALPLRQALADAKQALGTLHDQARKAASDLEARAGERRSGDIRAAVTTFEPALSERRRRLQQELADARAEFEAGRRAREEHHNKVLAQARARHAEQRERLEQRHARRLGQAADRRRRLLGENQARHDADRADLASRWTEGLRRVEELVRQSRRLNEHLDVPWSSIADARRGEVPENLQLVRFGELRVDINRIGAAGPRRGRYRLDVPEQFSLPAMLALPQQASLLIRTQREGRRGAMAALHAVMLRLLTSLPAGRVRLSLFDPVRLGEGFAGFMHLADYDEALVGTRIWSEPEHIEQRLIDLTQHMENVIQKYLRNEFETIVRYNEQAGELAEPYRFVVIADFPANFTDESVQRLLSIVHSGPRCGVYTLIVRNAWQELPGGIEEADLRQHAVVLHQDGEQLAWDDEVYGRFPLRVDAPPTESVQTEILRRVGERARQASNVEVPFSAITPGEGELWSADTVRGVAVAMGRCGATRLQHLTLGRGVAQHVLIAGKTGSGKSTLLHVLVTNLALWHSPQEVEFYLIDFKKGVEFKPYAVHALPHARAIAIESDREFGVSVLEKVDEEMNRRGELFRAAGVQDLPAYRQAQPARTLPRTLLLIDEFQELFTEDDRLAQRAAMLLDRLVRQGRAFGIHVLLGSQTLGGTSGLPRGTMGQMAVRIALQCSEADSQLILNDDNTAAKLLSRPGEAIYNDAGGLIEGNSPFQISWLPDVERDACLARIERLTAERGVRMPKPIVFEGNAPAEIADNDALAEQIAEWPPAAPPAAPLVWVGEPITIKAPTAARFRRQSGANMVLVGQDEELALAALASSLLSLAAQHPAGGVRLCLLDSSPPDSPAGRRWQALADALPHRLERVGVRQAARAVAELADEVRRRLEGDLGEEPPVFVLIYGLQRFRMLRRSEDDFAFSTSADSAEAAPRPDREFAEVLREGPGLGVHTIAWCDTLASLERTLDRQSVREFDCRLLFQMSATDSSSLIDSPDANRLGFYRALLYSEEHGYRERFRPYAFPQPAWLAEFAAKTKG